MIYAGIDIGSRSAKAVLLNDDAILSSAITDTGPESVRTSHLLLEKGDVVDFRFRGKQHKGRVRVQEQEKKREHADDQADADRLDQSFNDICPHSDQSPETGFGIERLFSILFCSNALI